MRVFLQINNCQQKNKNKHKTKQKGGAPLLGLAKSIYSLHIDFVLSILFLACVYNSGACGKSPPAELHC